MYEIRMNVGIKRIFDSNWNLQERRKGIEKTFREREFCHFDLLCYGILYRISKQSGFHFYHYYDITYSNQKKKWILDFRFSAR